MSDGVALFYDEDKNAEGRSFPGVPLTDLTQQELEALPTWIRESVQTSEMYGTSYPEGRRERERQAARAANPLYDLGVAEARAYLESVDDPAELDRLTAAETATKNRKGVLDAIAARRVALEPSDANEEPPLVESEGSE